MCQLILTISGYKNKEGTKIHELCYISDIKKDFTESDIQARGEKIMTAFLDYLGENELLK